MRNIKFNYLKTEFEKAFNASDVLGNDVFDSCPTLVQYEDTLVEAISGSAKYY